ncbi:nucleoside 2-deoxyribosyltransferase domain-containing protein (plasmid) [Streptomyces sp. NBC_01310]|uniref:nucleoside 2-deoxyribosyltransferase domain-containing protein n=1 Tax=Streptomyces sp. NBC_01310 TaxID=2903820 RepID=UPI0035B62AA9|nr:nucleoside 2-deoxyribosyltransferase domain-containing protein [Streptomyces sp. NBC_01310]
MSSLTPTVIYAREPLPASGPSVFLAGPTPRAGGPVPSWRPAAIEELAARWSGEQPLTVLTPESRGGVRAKHYDDQVGWETEARAAADAILFWIPRDLETLPGFTTNVEFGLDVSSGKAVLGAPADCPNPERNRYLVYVAEQHRVPVRDTLADTAAAALDIVAARQENRLSADRQIDKARAAAAIVRLGLEQLLAEAKNTAGPAVRVEILRLLHRDEDQAAGILAPLADIVTALGNSVCTAEDTEELDLADSVNPLDEAAAYLQDYAGQRIDRARQSLEDHAREAGQ